jgi:hypothetical protein
MKMPNMNVPNIEWDKAAAGLGDALKEAAYVAVGLGVLSFQRAQVRRVEMAKQFTKLTGETANPAIPDLETVLSQLGGVAKLVDTAMSPARKQVDEQLDRIEEMLPEAARKTVKSVRANALSQEQAIRAAVGLS